MKEEKQKHIDNRKKSLGFKKVGLSTKTFNIFKKDKALLFA